MTSLNCFLMVWITVTNKAPLILEQIKICFKDVREKRKGVSH